MSSIQSPRPVKYRRVTRACDYCHRRAIRCRQDPNAPKCDNCVEFDQTCTYLRKAKKRGTQPRLSIESSVAAPSTSSQSFNGTHSASQKQWSAPLIASQAVVMSLAEVYFEIVYPVFPLFHHPTYLRKIARGEHLTDRRLFSTTMALCALVSARVRDQALFNTSHNMDELTEVSSETFYEAAIQASIDADFRAPQTFDSLRTCALLALTAVQYGKIREMQAFLGRYHTYVAVDGLQDESNWPADTGIVETEERRRLVSNMLMKTHSR